MGKSEFLSGSILHHAGVIARLLECLFYQEASGGRLVEAFQQVVLGASLLTVLHDVCGDVGRSLALARMIHALSIGMHACPQHQTKCANHPWLHVGSLHFL